MPKFTCPPLFERASQSKILTATPLIFGILMSILLLILTGDQAGDIVPDAVSDDWDCGEADTLSEYVFPWHAEFKVNIDTSTSSSIFADINGEYGCRWRQRNTIFRGIMVSLFILTAILSLIVIFFKPIKDIWTALWWCHWLLFVMMFIVFILDCDALNSGFQTCLDDFSVFVGFSGFW
eukprot:158581_1